MNKSAVLNERGRGVDVPAILVAIFFVGLSLLYSLKLPVIARWLPRSEWFYLGLLIIAVLMIIDAFRTAWVRTLAGMSVVVSLTISVVFMVSAFLFFRLDRQRLEALSARARAVQDYRIQPSALPRSVEKAQFVPVGSLYQLSFTYPPAVFLNEDAEIELSNVYLSPAILDALKPILNEPLDPEFGKLPDNLRRSLKLQEIDASVELVSRSFLIDPAGPVKFPLVGGSKLSFVGHPQELGVRKILVRSSINPGFIEALRGVAQFDHNDLTLSINVMPERTILGLTGAQLQAIQIVTSSIGFPALALAGLTIFREIRKERRGSRAKSPKKSGKR